LIPPSGGYRGLDNRTYRVEIHDKAGPATFKWSRDNGSVVTTVTTINSTRDELGVVRTQRDHILRFSTNDWVEITDDFRELAGLPGEIRKIADVKDGPKTIKLAKPLTAGLFPTDAQGNVTALRHTRVRRWDQKGIVRDGNGNQLLDLDAPTSTGVIPIPPAGTAVLLEDGVQVSFSVDPVGGGFRVGDYWVFTARTADAIVEPLTQAPPRGIHHHYARLGLITLPSSPPIDCRVPWPPLVDGGKSCDCTVCVSPDNHNNNKLTIQAAIELVRAAGGGKVCLLAGVYNIGPDPVAIAGIKSLRIAGKGRETILVYSGRGPAVAVNNSADVTLEEFTLRFPPGRDTPPTALATGCVGVLLHNCQLVRVQGCLLQQLDPTKSGGVAVGFSGLLKAIAIRDNTVEASIGIASLAAAVFDPTQRITAVGASVYTRCQELLIQDNDLTCPQVGVRLDGYTLFDNETRIAGNSVQGGADAGITVIGLVGTGGHVAITDNEVLVTGDAIRAGVDQAAIAGNVITGVSSADGPLGAGSGIALVPSLDPKGMLRVQVVNNAIATVGGAGIVLRAALLSAIIKQNRIENVSGAGIIMESTSSADTLSIANNQVLNVGQRNRKATAPLAGIQVFLARHADLTDNSVKGVGLRGVNFPSYAGIFLMGCNTMKVSGNEVGDVGPGGEVETLKAGILVNATFEHLEIGDNIVRRTPTGPNDKSVVCAALVIQGASVRSISMSGLGFVQASELIQAGFFGGRLLKLPLGLENVSVRGNRLAGNGLTPTVLTDVRGQCLFHDNHCQRETR
jgi:hypothetical protein